LQTGREGNGRMGQQIIVSNGFGRFHMRLAAVEAGRRDALAAFVTGAYPTPGLPATLRDTAPDDGLPVQLVLGAR
jgi:hypothetical protein